MVKIRSAALVLAAALLAGCSSTDVPPASLSPDEAPSLEFNAQESFVIGTVQHGPADEPQYAEDGVTPLPLEYDGDMLTIPYKVYVDGRSGNIGFFVFWDGVPVAYDVGEGTQTAYFHTFTQEEGQENLEFSIRVIPTGNAGEMHTITFASIYNPDYKPDMESSSGYGAYHNMVCCSRSVYLSAAPGEPARADATVPAVHEFAVTQEELTHRFIKEDLAVFYGCEDLTMEALDETVRFAEFIDGKIVFDHYAVTENTATIDFCLCGTDGKEYAVNFFLDHQPAFETQRVALKKGMVTRLSVSVDPAELNHSATSYFIAVPLDADGAQNPEKSASILLYQQ